MSDEEDLQKARQAALEQVAELGRDLGGTSPDGARYSGADALEHFTRISQALDNASSDSVSNLLHVAILKEAPEAPNWLTDLSIGSENATAGYKTASLSTLTETLADGAASNLRLPNLGGIKSRDPFEITA